MSTPLSGERPASPSTTTTSSTALTKLHRLGHRSTAFILGPLAVGLVAVFLAIQSDHASKFNQALYARFPLLPLVLMPAGFALLAFLSTRYFAGTAGSGIPQAIAALDETTENRSGRFLSLRTAFGKVVLTLGSLATGASVGREGPTVQIGASIMHFFHDRGPFRGAEQRRIFILAGSAAGIAAAFNTPLAGIMFAIEELSKKHVFNANSSTLTTVVFAGLISLFLLGNYAFFGATDASLDWQSGAVAVLVCGVIGGTAGGLFSRLLMATSADLPRRLPKVIGSRPLAIAAACGFAAAVIGVATDGAVFGTGYEATRMTLEDKAALPWYFGIAKAAVTLLSALSGVSGGVLAPSLSVGAGIGDNLVALLPSLAPHSAVILLMMAAYLSGITREPITSFIIMMEMTSSHHMLLPLMATSVLASGASKCVCPAPLFQTLADRLIPPQGVAR